MAARQTRPTDVSVILAYLVGLDDFANKAMILAEVKIPDDRVRPALAHLAKHKAIDCVIVNGNELWWFATPERDDRTRVAKATPEGITRNEKGRRFTGRTPLIVKVKTR